MSRKQHTLTKPYGIGNFAHPTLEIAPKLIGKIIEFNGVGGRIVEVEAYMDDPASHGFTRTTRSSIMFDTFGHIYVYIIYGMYYCINFTTDKHSVGGILIRAVEPLFGIEQMIKRRKIAKVTSLCSGPGKLCQAFGFDLTINHTKIGDKVKLYNGKAGTVESSPRIGITKAVELPWRFYEKDSSFLSRKS